MSTIQTQLNTFLFDTYNVPWFPLAFTTFQHIKVLATEDDWRCNNSSTLNFCVLHNWLCSSAVFFGCLFISYLNIFFSLFFVWILRALIASLEYKLNEKIVPEKRRKQTKMLVVGCWKSAHAARYECRGGDLRDSAINSNVLFMLVHCQTVRRNIEGRNIGRNSILSSSSLASLLNITALWWKQLFMCGARYFITFSWHFVVRERYFMNINVIAMKIHEWEAQKFPNFLCQEFWESRKSFGWSEPLMDLMKIEIIGSHLRRKS